jgi:hypothetical protein
LEGGLDLDAGAVGGGFVGGFNGGFDGRGRDGVKAVD